MVKKTKRNSKKIRASAEQFSWNTGAADVGDTPTSHASAVNLSSTLPAGSFGNPLLPLVIDIHSGRGTWAMDYAAQHKDLNVLGLEKRPGLVQLALSRKERRGPTNVHFIECDANACLQHILADLRVRGVDIHMLAIQLPAEDFGKRKKQQKQRVVTEDLVNVMAAAVSAGVSIFLQSDIEDVEQSMVEVFAASPFFTPGSGYEERSLKSNSKSWNMSTYRKICAPNQAKPVYRMLFDRNDVPYSRSSLSSQGERESKTVHLPHQRPVDLSSTWLVDSFATRSLPVVIDIGCAKGTWAINYATQHKDLNVLGLEMRSDAVKLALSRKERLGLANVHFMACNANVGLQHVLEDLRADKVAVRMLTIHHPAPDHKEKQQKRRLVVSELVSIIAAGVPAGVLVFLQHDSRKDAKRMVEAFTASPFFSPGDGYHPQSLKTNPKLSEVETEREIATRRKGKPVYRMLFERNDARVSKKRARSE